MVMILSLVGKKELVSVDAGTRSMSQSNIAEPGKHSRICKSTLILCPQARIAHFVYLRKSSFSCSKRLISFLAIPLKVLDIFGRY
jgi:hypothetical protein